MECVRAFANEFAVMTGKRKEAAAFSNLLQNVVGMTSPQKSVLLVGWRVPCAAASSTLICAVRLLLPSAAGPSFRVRHARLIAGWLCDGAVAVVVDSFAAASCASLLCS